MALLYTVRLEAWVNPPKAKKEEIIDLAHHYLAYNIHRFK